MICLVSMSPLFVLFQLGDDALYFLTDLSPSMCDSLVVSFCPAHCLSSPAWSKDLFNLVLALACARSHLLNSLHLVMSSIYSLEILPASPCLSSSLTKLSSLMRCIFP
jgi:hypothetical protein